MEGDCPSQPFLQQINLSECYFRFLWAAIALPRVPPTWVLLLPGWAIEKEDYQLKAQPSLEVPKQSMEGCLVLRLAAKEELS